MKFEIDERPEVWMVVMQLAESESGRDINDGIRMSDIFTTHSAAEDYKAGKEADNHEYEKLKIVYRTLRDECPLKLTADYKNGKKEAAQ